MLRVSGCINTSVYERGDHLIVRYDPLHPSDAEALLYRPYFKPGELKDTTEGILIRNGIDLYDLHYKLYDSEDSLDIIIQHKQRYIAHGMYDTLPIKTHGVYKIIYNKKDKEHKHAEILFKKVIDTSHLKYNKHLYAGLDRLLSNPADTKVDMSACITLDSDKAFYFFQRGKAHQNLREYKDATNDFTTYILKKPDDIRGYLSRAESYLQLRKYEEALKDIENVLSMDNKSSEAYYLKGVLYFDQKEYQKAIDLYTEAINHCTGKQKEVYYFDRAVAREKLSGKNNSKAKLDYRKAEAEAAKYNEDILQGHHHTHDGTLHHQGHSIYGTFTSDNLFTSYSCLNPNMQVGIAIPYSIIGDPKILHYKTTFSLNPHKSKHSSFVLGTLSLEVGKFKRLYGRVETGAITNTGKGDPAGLRIAMGYNIKLSSNDFLVIRPELGCTYINRRILSEDNIILNSSAPPVLLDGTKFSFHKSDNTDKEDYIDFTLRENILNFSPAVGVWLWPYSSKFVFRMSAGYNWCFSQKYSLYFESDKNISEHKLIVTQQIHKTPTVLPQIFLSIMAFFMELQLG